jgi:hypothetical protein
MTAPSNNHAISLIAIPSHTDHGDSGSISLGGAPWHASCMCMTMSFQQRGVPVSILMKRSGVSFFTRRVLQRWLRGEISTDTAVELIQGDQAERIIGTWTNLRA